MFYILQDQYSSIAQQYKRSKQVPWRHHVEQFSLFQLAGDLTGKSVLDVACGEGHYTRLVKALGASTVAGVDLSPNMIELAKSAEHTNPQGIQYIQADAREMKLDQTFDFVIAAYLLNYAQTEEDLRAMCKSIGRCLKPGGRFVTVNNNPDQGVATFEATRKYGFIKTPVSERCIRYTFYVDNSEFQIDNYLLERDLHRTAFEDAGFTGVEWKPVTLAPDTDREHWENFFLDPPVVLLHCTKL